MPHAVRGGKDDMAAGGGRADGKERHARKRPTRGSSSVITVGKSPLEHTRAAPEGSDPCQDVRDVLV